MTRKMNSPTVDYEQLAQSIKLGGTESTTLAGAATKLNLVTNSMKDVANGIPSLDSNSKILTSKVPVLTAGNHVNLTGSYFIVINDVVTFKINDYDSNKNYNPSVSIGSISQVGDTLTYTAPGTVQASVTMTVGGRAITFAVQASQPTQPTITSPTNGATNLGRIVNVTSSAFAYKGNAVTHISTDWQIATDQQFTNIVIQSINDTVNKTSWTGSVTAVNTKHYIRCRFKGSSGNYGPYNLLSSFTTALTFSPNIEEAKLIASDKATNDSFGSSVSISSDGSRVIVGSPYADPGAISSAGAAYIFSRSGTVWTQEAKLTASDKTNGAYYGICVSMSSDGSRVAIGAFRDTHSSIGEPGSTYVFSRSGTVWTQEAKLIASDKSATDQFGCSISISSDGSRLIVGSRQANPGALVDAGAAYVFSRSGTIWTEEAKLTATDKAVSDLFGHSVSMSLDGSRAIIGAPYVDFAGSNSGAAYVFSRSGTTWTQEAKIVPNDKTTSDIFGHSVSMSSDGSRITVGKPGSSSGAAYVFSRSGTTWTQEAKLTASNGSIAYEFGLSVSMSSNGDRVIVGADHASPSSITNAGSAYIYSRSGTTWTEESILTASDKAAGDNLGWSVFISSDGTRVIVAANNADPSAITDSGAVYIYR